MKKGLLGSTALIAATALTAGMAQAQAPEIKFSGFINFQVYVPDNDPTGLVYNGHATTAQDDAALYFGVDDAELHINITATADNGLEYGAKIELEADTAYNGGANNRANNADEARIQLRGSWGTLQMGDEDGAEDIMNYGGENVMGATGGFDGDFADAAAFLTLSSVFSTIAGFTIPSPATAPTIAGDTSDATKLTYYSPRFSGIQVGVSYTPDTSLDGDELKFEGPNDFVNSIGIGANYDGSFGDVRVRVSGVYIMDESKNPNIEDTSAYSLGAIIGFGPFQLGANWTDNGDSRSPVGSGFESSYWNVAAGFETGPLYFSAGYMAVDNDLGILGVTEEFTNLALTVDYTVAPGLTAYAEYTMIEDDAILVTTESNTIIAGVNLSF